MDANQKRTFAMALAGGAIATALLDTLHEKGVLTLDESRAVLDRAFKQLGTVASQEGGYEAVGIVSSMMSGRYSARR
jgi:hypothetical protein